MNIVKQGVLKILVIEWGQSVLPCTSTLAGFFQEALLCKVVASATDLSFNTLKLDTCMYVQDSPTFFFVLLHLHAFCKKSCQF